MEKKPDINDKLISSFVDINHTVRSLYEGRGSQKRILIVLLETGTISQRTLTKRLGIQPGSASEVIAKMERGGVITRTESPDDRRTVDIALTDQGRLLAEEAAAQRRTRHKEMFSCLTEDEKSALFVLLEKVNEDWRRRYGSAKDSFHGGTGGSKHDHEKERR